MSTVQDNLQDSETKIIYAFYMSVEDSNRISKDEEFASAMLRHAKIHYKDNVVETANANLNTPSTSQDIDDKNIITDIGDSHNISESNDQSGKCDKGIFFGPTINHCC